MARRKKLLMWTKTIRTRDGATMKEARDHSPLHENRSLFVRRAKTFLSQCVSWTATLGRVSRSKGYAKFRFLDLPTEIRLMVYKELDEPRFVKKVSCGSWEDAFKFNMYLFCDPSKAYLTGPHALNVLPKVCRQTQADFSRFIVPKNETYEIGFPTEWDAYMGWMRNRLHAPLRIFISRCDFSSDSTTYSLRNLHLLFSYPSTVREIFIRRFLGNGVHNVNEIQRSLLRQGLRMEQYTGHPEYAQVEGVLC